MAACALVLVVPGAGALPGEPSAEVVVTPNDTTVDASGINPVDTAFRVNVTGNNLGPRSHTMWVNLSFSTSTGWKVSPASANLTLSLPAAGSDATFVTVTVTVPPRVSANNVSVFAAAYRAENDIRLSQGQSGNATAQIHIRQIFSTGAEFLNGTSQLSVRQGQDGNLSVKVTNRGNGDATYDAQLLNAADLRPNDVLLQSTAPATVGQNGTGVVRVVIHANPAAIAGTYALQIRVLASGAGTPPPAGAFADLTGQLTVLPAAPPPPPGNNTTQPPPAQNNTTNPPPGGNPPVKQQDVLAGLWGFMLTPTGLVAAAILIGVGVAGGLLALRLRREKRRKLEVLRARQKRAGGFGPPAAPPGMALAVGPGVSQGPVAPRRVQRVVVRPGGPPPAPGAPPRP